MLLMNLYIIFWKFRFFFVVVFLDFSLLCCWLLFLFCRLRRTEEKKSRRRFWFVFHCSSSQSSFTCFRLSFFFFVCKRQVFLDSSTVQPFLMETTQNCQTPHPLRSRKKYEGKALGYSSRKSERWVEGKIDNFFGFIYKQNLMLIISIWYFVVLVTFFSCLFRRS